MRKRHVTVSAVIAAIAVAALAAVGHAAPGRPYVLPNAQVFDLHSTETNADYQIYVATPPGYPQAGKRYPVVYALDADYSFALTHNVIQHFVERQGLPEMILVAIAYPGAAADRNVYKMTRTRDYTPVFVAGDVGYGAQFQKVSGGAPKFKAFMAKELFPFVERTFAADPADRTIVGHSYGGLFAAYLLLTEPSMYKRYVIVSPSLWYAGRNVFQLADAAPVKPSNAHVFLSVGALENPMMSSDLTALYDRLQSSGSPDLKVTMQIFENERHDSVFPTAVVRGLRTVFESLGPRPETNTP